MIDFISVSGLFLLFVNDFNTDISSVWNFAQVFLVFGLIIGIFQAVVFKTQLKLVARTTSPNIRRSYIYNPTIHAFTLIGVLNFVSGGLIINNSNFLAFLLINLISGEFVVGLFFSYSRFMTFFKNQPVPSNYVAKQSDNFEEGVKQQNFDEKNERERMIAKSQIGFKY